MKQFKISLAYAELCHLSFAVQPMIPATNDELRTELQQIQQRLAMLEARKRRRFYRILSLIFMVLYARLSA